jgi:hypothetical protein
MTTTRRNYRDGEGKKLPGVTTVLGVLEKPALVPWAARIAAEATAAAMVDGGQPAERAIDIGRLAPFKRRQDAADAGTLAHACVDAHFAKRSEPEGTTDEARACAARAIAHITDKGYVVEQTEWASSVGHIGQGFGGTLDMIVRDADGKRYVADLKTGKAPYDEVVPQLAAYRHLWEMAHPEQPIDGAVVFHAPLEGDTVNEIWIEETTLTAGWILFQGALHCYHARRDARLPRVEEEKDEVEQ